MVVLNSGYARDLTKRYTEQQLIGSLIQIESSVWYTHYGVVTDVDDDNVYMVHLTDNGKVTRQLVTDYAGKTHLGVKISNYLDEKYKPYPAEEVVIRAKEMIGGTANYGIITYNCEHFANWCRYGRQISTQSDRARAFAPVTVPALGLSWLFGGTKS